VLTAVPLLAVAVNVRRTLEGQCSRLAATPASLFIGFATAAWVIAGAMRIAGAVPVISPFTSLTWFGVAQSELNSYGFFAMILFGTIYYSLPRVTGVEWPSSGSVRAHFWLGSTGIVLAAAPLAVGGILQGLKLNDEHVAFAELTKSTLPFLRASTTGDLLMLIGNLLLAVNVFRLWVRFGRARLAPFCAALAGGLRPAEVKP
jgi:cytochrome c oxidase cbb3-type subunit 1